MTIQCDRCQLKIFGHSEADLYRKIVAHIQNGECDRRKKARNECTQKHKIQRQI